MNSKIEILKLGINFDLKAEIESRAKMPIKLNTDGEIELKKTIVKQKQSEEIKNSKEEERQKQEAEHLKKCQAAIALLEANSAKSIATPIPDIMQAAGGIPDAEFKKMMTQVKKILKDRGLEIQKTTRKGIAYFTLIKF